jgi:high-affinity iron transporter
VLGLATAIALGYLLYRGGIKLNLRTFFKVTGALILVVAAGLFAFSIHEIQEAGYLAIGTGKAFDISGILSDQDGVGAVLRAVVGYQDAPSVLEVLAWVGYVVVTGFLFFRPGQPAVRPVPQTSAASRD